MKTSSEQKDTFEVPDEWDSETEEETKIDNGSFQNQSNQSININKTAEDLSCLSLDHPSSSPALSTPSDSVISDTTLTLR